MHSDLIAKLTEAQRSTLREMASYGARPYWFRQATCKALVDLGLAEPTRLDLKRSPHRITAAGRATLKALEARDG
ncbi:hypothetical protein [Aquamicrobium defluvii]|uniref:hypothetical protein n=1 Tax=Aquamicrobium defluvii TaxID=69279 RepID=UPI00054E3BC6|nr:hypothetical protein [Aquamicrobium defluvii]